MEEEEEEEKKKLINKKKKKRKEKKQIFENLKNEEIKYTIFCGYCAGMHRNENCPLKDEYSNEFDEARKNIIKKILDKRNKENEEQQLLTSRTDDRGEPKAGVGAYCPPGCGRATRAMG